MAKKLSKPRISQKDKKIMSDVSKVVKRYSTKAKVNKNKKMSAKQAVAINRNIKKIETKLQKYSSGLKRNSRKYKITRKVISQLQVVQKQKWTWKRVFKIMGGLIVFLFLLAVILGLTENIIRRFIPHGKNNIFIENKGTINIHKDDDSNYVTYNSDDEDGWGHY